MPLTAVPPRLKHQHEFCLLMKTIYNIKLPLQPETMQARCQTAIVHDDLPSTPSIYASKQGAVPRGTLTADLGQAQS